MTETREFQYYSYWLVVGFAYLSVIIYLSLTPDPPSVSDWPNFDKIEHFVAYGLLMGWFGQLFAGFRRCLMWAITFSFLGIALEFAQEWGGQRFFDLTDMLANTAGVLLGWWLSQGWLSGYLLRIDARMAGLLRRQI